jgi:hypothetical protein
LGTKGHVDHIQAIGLVDLVNVAITADNKAAQVLVGAFPAEDGVGGVSLAVGDQVASAIGTVVNIESFDVGHQVVGSHRLHHGEVVAAFGFGREPQDTHFIFQGNVEQPPFLVND